jgi:F420-dependent hydroxymycolic acid dehydrogenase
MSTQDVQLSDMPASDVPVLPSRVQGDAGVLENALRMTTQPTPAHPRRNISPIAPRSAGARVGMIGFVLAHEQFTVPQLIEMGAHASRSGFQLLATSDHLQPWQANEAHSGEAWVTLGALGAQAPEAWMGTSVTCPTIRYNPAVVAEAFATLSHIYPGRIFLGVGSGEALNEKAATGSWPAWQERWDRLAEAIAIIRELWTGEPVSHKGRYYTVDAKLYDPPPQPIPLFTAANGKQSMRLAGQHGDGLITDPESWKNFRGEWEKGARDAGKDPAGMPVMIEHFVVVGDETDALLAAEQWRFIPKAFKTYFNVIDPAEIQRRAEAEVALDQLAAKWPVSTDPEEHIAAIQKLFDSGVSIVNIHSGQADQAKVIEFYASQVLPRFNQAA